MTSHGFSPQAIAAVEALCERFQETVSPQVAIEYPPNRELGDLATPVRPWGR